MNHVVVLRVPFSGILISVYVNDLIKVAGESNGRPTVAWIDGIQQSFEIVYPDEIEGRNEQLQP